MYEMYTESHDQKEAHRNAFSLAWGGELEEGYFKYYFINVQMMGMENLKTNSGPRPSQSHLHPSPLLQRW